MSSKFAGKDSLSKKIAFASKKPKYSKSVCTEDGNLTKFLVNLDQTSLKLIFMIQWLEFLCSLLLCIDDMYTKQSLGIWIHKQILKIVVITIAEIPATTFFHVSEHNFLKLHPAICLQRQTSLRRLPDHGNGAVIKIVTDNETKIKLWKNNYILLTYLSFYLLLCVINVHYKACIADMNGWYIDKYILKMLNKFIFWWENPW